MQKEIPNIDDEICLALLEDFDYNLKDALQGARDMENIYNTFQQSGSNTFSSSDYVEEEEFIEPPTEQQEVPPSVAQLREFFPDIDVNKIIETLESVNNNVEVAAELLMNQDQDFIQIQTNIPPHRQGRKRKKNKEVLTTYSGLPMKQQRQKRQKKPKFDNKKHQLPQELVRILNRSYNREKSIEELREVFPNIPVNIIEDVLNTVNDDMERASNILTDYVPPDVPTVNPDVITIHEIFPTASIEQINEVYEKSGHCIERATDILALQQSENPPPIDVIIALYPDLSDRAAEYILNSSNGDVFSAARYCDSIPRRPPQRVAKKRVRVITVDLHNYTYEQAQQLVSACLSRAPHSDIKNINFITGKGIHSKNGPVIRPLVMKMCKEFKIPAKVNPNNTGVVVVDFSGIP